MGTLTNEGATPFLDDGVSEVMHQAASPAKAPPVKGKVVQEIRVQEGLIGSFCHEGTKFQDGSNIIAGLPARPGQREEAAT